MARLKIYSLGTFQAELDEQAVGGFESDKVRLLLLYLAVENSHPHRREKLAALFWPDRSESDGRTNLRRALANLRKAISDHQAQPPFLRITRQTIQLHPQASIWFDAAQLTAAADQQELDLQTLESAAALYGGDFIAGLNVKGCLDLDEWLLLQREHLARCLVLVLEKLTQYHSQRGQYDLALSYVRRRVELEPWQEQGHRELMRLLAYTGQRNKALVQYQTCRRLLVESLGVEPAQATTELYERIRRGAVGHTQESEPQHNLPASLTPLIGREEELAAARACLEAPDCRLLTLSGPGGIGKTRLALEAASSLSGRFPDGVFFVSLAAVDDPADVVTAVAETLSVPPAPGKNPIRPLLDYLQPKHMLLLLDNFEHLLASADQVGQMLLTAPQLHILVTSRASLNLPDEHILPLTGLSYPAVNDNFSEEYGAVQLFCRHARQLDAHFEETVENLEAAAAVCRQVEGLPLAILLAATWVRLLTPPEIADNLQHNLDLLAADWCDVPDRQRSITAVLQHSWKLLTPEARKLLSSLSVFRGGFSLDAATKVTAATLPGLRYLINHSLLNRSPTGRFYLHTLLHQFAQERLAEDGDLDQQVHAAHGVFFCQKMGAWGEEMKGAQQQVALAQFINERENGRMAWQWAVAEQKVDLLATAVDGLCRFYEWRVHYRQGLDACRAALAMIEEMPVHDKSTLGLQIRLLVWQSTFCWRLGDKKLAQSLLTRCENIVDQLASASEVIEYEMGTIRYMQGRLAESDDRHIAQAFYQQALNCFRSAGDVYEMAKLEARLGSVTWNLGSYGQAAVHDGRALRLRQSIQDWRGVARSKLSLGITWMHQGRFAEAETLVREGSNLRRESGDRLGIADSYRFWALTRMAQGEYSRASELLLNSVTIYEELGLKYGLEMGMLAAALAHEGRFAEANAWTRRGLAYARETGYRRALGYGLLKKGELALVDGRFHDAESALIEGQQIYCSLDQRDELCQLLAARAFLGLRRGSPEQAEDCLQEALALVQESRSFLALLHLLPALAALLRYRSRSDEAERIFSLAARYPLISHSHWFKAALGEQAAYLAEADPEPASSDDSALDSMAAIWQWVGEFRFLL